jgi:hypothetical protein
MILKESIMIGDEQQIKVHSKAEQQRQTQGATTKLPNRASRALVHSAEERSLKINPKMASGGEDFLPNNPPHIRLISSPYPQRGHLISGVLVI